MSQLNPNSTPEHLREMDKTGGIGETMSELNPALMQELERLRSEHANLTLKLDATSVDTLDRLERSLADQRAMTSSLQVHGVN